MSSEVLYISFKALHIYSYQPWYIEDAISGKDYINITSGYKDKEKKYKIENE